MGGVLRSYRTGGVGVTIDYPCGCRSRNGIVIARCAWAAALKAKVDRQDRDMETRWGRLANGGNVSPAEFDAIEDAKAAVGKLNRQLLAHYPSKFAAPLPCGPIGGAP